MTHLASVKLNQNNRYSFTSNKRCANSKIVDFNKAIPLRYVSYAELSPQTDEFLKLIEKRKEYLEGLNNLEDNWSSGRSIKPSNNSLSLAKKTLNVIGDFYQKKNDCIPRLIIGPIPSGGVTIELHGTNKNHIEIEIKNNGSLNLEYSKADFYFEDKISSTNELFKYFSKIL